jgi:hypothetical protein
MNEMDQMFSFLQENDATIGELWKCLITFRNFERKFEELYEYILNNFMAFRSSSLRDSQLSVCEETSRAFETNIFDPEKKQDDIGNPSKRTKICETGNYSENKIANIENCKE